MEQLSVVIITYNEERNIARCIESVAGIADDIVVVDSFSTDRTKEICQNQNVRFIEHVFEGYIEQKNYAITCARYPFVLSLDADEALSEPLQKSILEAKKDKRFDGYAMNRLTNYCGTWIKHCGWYPDKKLRLWDSAKGQWGGVNPHDKFIMEKNAKIGNLQGDLLHYSYYSLDDHYRQIEKFTAIAAYELFEKKVSAGYLKVYLKTIAQYIKTLILKLGFLDGKMGWRIARLSAYATYRKYDRLRTLNKNRIFRRIIISRTDSIGDVVLTLPLAGKIRELFPDTEIIFLGKSYTEPVIRCCSYVDRFENWNKVSDRTLKEQADFLKEIEADAIIFAFPAKDVCFASKKARIPSRIATLGRIVTLQTCNRLVFFTRKFSSLSEAQLNMHLLRPLGLRKVPSFNEVASLAGWKSPEAQNEEHKTLLRDNRKKIILHPKSKGNAPEWPVGRFSELIREFSPDDYVFYITGTSDERKVIGDELFMQRDNVVDFCGKMSLDEFIAFIPCCHALVASGTGPLHIAAVSNIVAIALFSPKRPLFEARWRPIGTKVEVITAQRHPQPGKGLDISASAVSRVLKRTLS